MKFKIALISLCVTYAVNAEVSHDAFGPIKIGERAKVVGNLTDNKSIKQARLYFKSNLSQKFSFTDLDMEGKSLYASLPAPGQSMQKIDYFFAVKYGNGELEQTSVYSLNIDSEWDAAAAKQYQKSLSVYSELDEDEGDGLLGFVDDIKTVYQYGKLLNEIGSAVELASYSNYTAVAGSPASSGAALSSSAAASSGIGTLGWVGIGVATLAGGAAIAASASDDDDDEEFDTSGQSGLTGQEGVVRVFLSWDSSSTDLDLYVTDPCGNELGFGQGDTATCQGETGVWDLDAQGDNGTEENMTWPNGAPKGSYSVRLNHYGGSTANYNIQVFNGNTSNSYSGSISDGQFPTITTFSFD